MKNLGREGGVELSVKRVDQGGVGQSVEREK